ncbi:hypothetical protein VTK26DRAFT_7508 [Humicola hyalothermophila]
MSTLGLVTLALLASQSSAHGVVTLMRGANGVDMPGLTVADGTPRTCSTNRCGSQADTAIIRDREIRAGSVGPLGRTQGSGPVDAATMIATFMGTAAAPANRTAGASAAAAGVEDDIDVEGIVEATLRGGRDASRDRDRRRGFGLAARQLFRELFGGGANRGTASQEEVEGNVAAMAGAGATSGLPTCGDDGIVEMVFHQVNQDGAGPLDAAIDGTSGGTDPAAFQRAEVTQDVPGLGFQGLSLATSRDFTLKVRMPDGMTCDATVAGVDNVCIVRVRNSALAGPFGGSAAFTQSPAARKRAIEYRLKRKRAQVFRA